MIKNKIKLSNETRKKFTCFDYHIIIGQITNEGRPGHCWRATSLKSAKVGQMDILAIADIELIFVGSKNSKLVTLFGLIATKSG